MKKLLMVIFALLPILAFAASPNHTATSTQTKSVKTAVKKVEAKKATAPKTVAKTAKKKEDAKKAEVKKPAKIVEAKKAVTKKEKIKNKTTNKAAKAEPTKMKGKQPVEKTKQTAVKDKKTVAKSKQSAIKESAKPKAVEKVTEKKVDAVLQKTASMVTKSVVVPRCNDSKVFAVLSDAFKKQGAATHTQMAVKQITQARETQSYPQQGIRSCNAIVETNGVKYVTDYSIILNDKGFFVQVENAQPAQRF
ncbi:hypothetical protein [Haemophilus parainfluenzae]|uniref:Uncharacterized protein n=1 Tax=Haemophilus parainfluenzae TaxID=729 RepID=A0A377JI86_HAEPA|nr:hypothetical protein [Haemophilus parainfluenzae]STP05296.1 Uncharacterised protein [Haemophilus parainfluenzae]